MGLPIEVYSQDSGWHWRNARANTMTEEIVSVHGDTFVGKTRSRVDIQDFPLSRPNGAHEVKGRVCVC